MKYSSPKKIYKPEPYLIAFEFSDGFKAVLTLQSFRQECPCAQCKGEVINGKVVVAPMLMQFKPGMYELKTINKVGNYAINPVWEDGHDTGIYNWDYLREIVENLALSDDEIETLRKKYNKK